MMDDLNKLATQVLELGKIVLAQKEKIEVLENRVEELEIQHRRIGE